MSLVIGIKEGNKVIFACDSQVTIGGVRKISKLKSNYKIWHPDQKNDVLMGAVGNVRENNVIKAIKDLIPELDYLKKDINLGFIVNKLIGNMMKELKDNHVISDKDNVWQMNNDYLFAYKDKLYQIFSSGAVMEIDEYTAIGSGSNEALASLRNSNEKGALERIKLAMDAASSNDIFIDYPLLIGDTENLEITTIKG